MPRYCSQAVGRLYRAKPIRPQMSVDARDLTNDLVIFGGLDGNQIAQLFFDSVREAFAPHAHELEFADTPPMTNAIPGLSRRDYDQNLASDSLIPGRDLGLVIVWRNPFTSDWRRGILCIGLTSYGTREAADWFFNEVIPPRSVTIIRELWAALPLRFRSPAADAGRLSDLRRLRRGLRRRTTCTFAVVEVRYYQSVVKRKLLGYASLVEGESPQAAYCVRG